MWVSLLRYYEIPVKIEMIQIQQVLGIKSILTKGILGENSHLTESLLFIYPFKAFYQSYFVLLFNLIMT